MKISIGNDIIANSRVRTAFHEHGERFLDRLYAEGEKKYCLGKKDPIPHLAARFACKEAFIKALDAGGEVRFDLREIELAGDYFGKKKLSLHGKTKEMFTDKGFTHMEVSISHCEEYSTAVVLLYKE
jgi:holo-[acyl-carrier protein] synthase